MKLKAIILGLNHRIVGIIALLIGVITVVFNNFWILFIAIFIIEWQIIAICFEPKHDLIKKYSLLMGLLEELSYIYKNTTLIVPNHETVTNKFKTLKNKIDNITDNIYCLLEQDTSLTSIQKEFLELYQDTNALNKDLKEKIERDNIINYRYDWNNIKDKYNKFISKLEDPDFIKIKSTVQDELLVSKLLLKNKWKLIDNHNSELVKTIQAWQGLLPSNIPLTEEIKNHNTFEGFDISYLFSWADIQGNYTETPIYILKQIYGLEWTNAANIAKTNNDKTIMITAGEHFLSLNLNNENTEINLEIDDGKTDKFIVRTKNDNMYLYISFIKKIEALRFLANEDIFYHCPNLKPIWITFKDMSVTHSENKQKLYNFIKDTIIQKLKTQNINIDTDSDGFYISIYNECIFKADNKDSGYDYFPKESDINETNQVTYCKVFEGEGHNPDTGTYYLLAQTNNRDKIITIHKNLVKEVAEQYIVQSKKLIETEAKLKETENALKEALKTILLNPIPKMNCNVILTKEETEYGNTSRNNHN